MSSLAPTPPSTSTITAPLRVWLEAFNPYHAPAGTPEGGEFITGADLVVQGDTAGQVTAAVSTWLSALGLDLPLDEAVEELRTKSLADIQRETALKWAARAVAATQRGDAAGAQEYWHEALEHAALLEDTELLRELLRQKRNTFQAGAPGLVLPRTLTSSLKPRLGPLMEPGAEPGPLGGLEATSGPHQYGVIMVPLAGGTAQAVMRLGYAIPDADLAAEGRECEPHCTILYGLHGEDGEADAIRKTVSGVEPFSVTLGELGVFEQRPKGTQDAASEPCDVIVCHIQDGPQLHALRKKVEQSGAAYTTSYPTYVPHITVAYVQPGKGQPFVDAHRTDLQGMVAQVEMLQYRPKNGSLTAWPLRKLNAFNPYHDEKGRFAEAPGGPGGTTDADTGGGRSSATAEDIYSRWPQSHPPVLPDGQSAGTVVDRSRLDREWERMEDVTDRGDEGETAALRQHLTEGVQSAMRNADVAVNVSEGLLGKVLDDGRVQNQFASRQSSGAYSPYGRARLEAALFGVPTNLEPSERPVYGFLIDKHGAAAQQNCWDGASQYGAVTLVLKDAVRDRTTVITGDSLDDGGFPMRIDKADYHILQSSDVAYALQFRETPAGADRLASITHASGPSDLKDFGGRSYIEAQVHDSGGVKTSDIDHVIFWNRRQVGTDSRETLKEKLTAAGIPYKEKKRL